VTWNDLELLHIWFLAVNVLYWISLYAVATTDPGYLPQNAAAYDEAIKQVLMCLLLILFAFADAVTVAAVSKFYQSCCWSVKS